MIIPFWLARFSWNPACFMFSAGSGFALRAPHRPFREGTSWGCLSATRRNGRPLNGFSIKTLQGVDLQNLGNSTIISIGFQQQIGGFTLKNCRGGGMSVEVLPWNQWDLSRSWQWNPDFSIDGWCSRWGFWSWEIGWLFDWSVRWCFIPGWWTFWVLRFLGIPSLFSAKSCDSCRSLIENMVPPQSPKNSMVNHHKSSLSPFFTCQFGGPMFKANLDPWSIRTPITARAGGSPNPGPSMVKNKHIYIYIYTYYTYLYRYIYIYSMIYICIYICIYPPSSEEL